MKSKNHVITSADQDMLGRLHEECRVYIGRESKLEEGKLTIFALPQGRKSKRKDDQKSQDKAERYSKRERDYGYARD